MIFDVGLVLFALPVAFIASYLAFLAAVARKPAQRASTAQPELTRFDIIVPAHDEAQVIARTVKSLLALDYPKSLFRVVVVADNCSDDTAKLARAAGATVWERQDHKLRGKGYALRFAFDRSLAEAAAHAVVVIDADTVVNAQLLRAFAARIAAGEQAIQAFYGVLNAKDSWRTQLMTLGLCLFNGMRSLARERLSLSSSLAGNGMCFARGLLERHPYDSYSLVEDLEFGVKLTAEGVRVAYEPGAEVRADMPSTESAARTQRQRWEEGRRAFVRAQLWPSVRRAFTDRTALSFDAAMNLLVPPLSKVVALTVAGLAASVALGIARGGQWPLGFGLFAFCAGSLVFYVLRGWALSQTGAAGLKALARAPMYMAWKLAISRARKEQSETWIRTARERSGETQP